MHWKEPMVLSQRWLEAQASIFNWHSFMSGENEGRHVTNGSLQWKRQFANINKWDGLTNARLGEGVPSEAFPTLAPVAAHRVVALLVRVAGVPHALVIVCKFNVDTAVGTPANQRGLPE